MKLNPDPVLDLFTLTCAEAAEAGRQVGARPAHVETLYRAVFQEGHTLPSQVPDSRVSPWLSRVRFPRMRVTTICEDGGVTKFAATLHDGRRIESVIIPSRGRRTVCVSSQVGCRMGCAYCATGRMGFARDLSAEEIVWQVYAARFTLKQPADNVVFMGMGEPLENLDAVAQAIRVLADPQGLDIPCRRITVSTAGHADGIRALGALAFPNLRLAVSVNAAEDDLRTSLMPINRRYPLARLRAAMETFPLGRRGTVLVEYVLLAGVNDGREHARALARYASGLPVRVNVMGYNPVAGLPFTAPSPGHVGRFCDWLMADGVFVRTRLPRGAGIQAACGQLGTTAV